MEIDEQTIRSLLVEQHITQNNIPCQGCRRSIGLNIFVERLTAGINAILSTIQQVDFIRDELDGLKEEYEENYAKLDIELAKLVTACKHPSWRECDKSGLSLVTCNICGGLI